MFNYKKLYTLPVRDGYNSVIIACNVDPDSGVTAVTLTDSSTTTTASETLYGTAKPLTVFLREAGGRIEWAPQADGAWQTLRDAGIDEQNALLLLAEALEFGKHEKIAGEGVAVTFDERVIRFRAREWKVGTDLITDAYLNGGANFDGGSNAKFNTIRLGEISSLVPHATTTEACMP